MKTFYKKTKTPLMSDAKSPNLNAQSDSVKSSVISSVSQEQENVERENFEVQPVDMFPNTSHVEYVTLLQRIDSSNR